MTSKEKWVLKRRVARGEQEFNTLKRIIDTRDIYRWGTCLLGQEIGTYIIWYYVKEIDNNC